MFCVCFVLIVMKGIVAFSPIFVPMYCCTNKMLHTHMGDASI